MSGQTGSAAKEAAWIRVLLLILGVFHLVTGIPMLFAPATWFFKLVPGVPETGPFNAHLVADSGTFFIAIGIGLLLAARAPRRHVVIVWVAGIAGLLHSLLHVYSHAEALLSTEHLLTEITGIYIPAALLLAMAWILTSNRELQKASVVRAA